jgi:hypothetical protein
MIQMSNKKLSVHFIILTLLLLFGKSSRVISQSDVNALWIYWTNDYFFSRICNLTKVYEKYPFCRSRGDVKAVDNLSLVVEEGEIFCLLGHNGAGKVRPLSRSTSKQFSRVLLFWFFVLINWDYDRFGFLLYICSSDDSDQYVDGIVPPHFGLCNNLWLRYHYSNWGNSKSNGGKSILYYRVTITSLSHKIQITSDTWITYQSVLFFFVFSLWLFVFVECNYAIRFALNKTFSGMNSPLENISSFLQYWNEFHLKMFQKKSNKN